MITLVAASAIGALILSYGLGAYLVAEYVRQEDRAKHSPCFIGINRWNAR